MFSNHDFDEVIFTPIVDIQEESSGSTLNEIPDCKMWTDAATKLLLANYKELCEKVGKSSSLKNKTKLWQTIAENISKLGYRFSPSQVESKFRGLKRQYKKMKLNNSKTGKNQVLCIYESELDEILGVKKEISPDYILDSESQQSPTSPPPGEYSQEFIDIDNFILKDEAPTTSSRAIATDRGKLLAKLDEISQRKEERDQQIIDILEKKEHRRIEKENQRKEREKRRKELDNHIIQLLEKVINKIS